MVVSWLAIRRSNAQGGEREKYPYCCTIRAHLGIPVAGSPTGENGCALLDKGLRCFPVILSAAGPHLVGGFHIEQLGQTAAFGEVQIALHQAKRDRGSMCHTRTRIRTENRRRKADRLETLMRVFAARRLAYRAGL
jgi:hypothetical protein